METVLSDPFLLPVDRQGKLVFPLGIEKRGRYQVTGWRQAYTAIPGEIHQRNVLHGHMGIPAEKTEEHHNMLVLHRG
jgi:hypothetical protein